MPPTVAAKTSRSCRRSPDRRCSTASTMASRALSSPETVRRGEPATVAPISACTSVTRARRPSIATVTQVPGTGSAYRVRNRPDGSGRLVDAALVHLEAAHLVGRAEAVLQPAHQPQRGVFVALELQHHVDQVLQHPGPGHLAVLGDVADQDGGDAALLGHGDQRGGDRPDLGDPARHARRCPGAEMVCTESITSRPGLTASRWPSTAARSVSAAR